MPRLTFLTVWKLPLCVEDQEPAGSDPGTVWSQAVWSRLVLGICSLCFEDFCVVLTLWRSYGPQI